MFAGLFCARARIIRSTCAIIQTIFHVITIQVIRIPARKYFHSVPLTVNQHFKSCVKNVSSKLQIICKYSKLGVCAGVCLSSRESRGPKDRSQWSSQSRAAVMCITVSHRHSSFISWKNIKNMCTVYRSGWGHRAQWPTNVQCRVPRCLMLPLANLRAENLNAGFHCSRFYGIKFWEKMVSDSWWSVAQFNTSCRTREGEGPPVVVRWSPVTRHIPAIIAAAGLVIPF